MNQRFIAIDLHLAQLRGICLVPECAPIPANLDYEIVESALSNEMIFVDNASGD
jgi:hypothetical protein|tara:strand:+ start:570 stop:731 length:162 start_codon:yes stop_codon:yes gene_type:complete